MSSIQRISADLDAPSSISDTQIMSYIWAVVCKLRASGEQDSIDCILCEQKLIHLSLLLRQKQKKDQPLILPFSLKEEINSFVMKVNRLSMENIKDQQQGGNIKFISKAVDAIMQPGINKYFAEQEQALRKLKILTFNNFSCILKKNRHFMMALKAMSYALQLEEQEIKDCKDENRYDIIPSYLNKAAILSEMGKHDKALQQIRKACVLTDKIEKDVQVKIKQCGPQNLSLLTRLNQKKHYGLYMKMLIFYNMGVEKQHQKFVSSAAKYYQESKRLAVMINNQMMAKRLQGIIANLK